MAERIGLDSKEEIILEVKLEQSDALTEMEKLKKSILQTKQEQAELNKAFKAGNITLDEYAQDSVRLEAILKKNQAAYNGVQKSVTGVKTQLDKLIDSNKKISNDLQKTSKSFQDVAGNINVAGVNVGSLATKFASFANPATAAVGIVTALGAAYARSTIGAKDLEFAQDQLNTAITIGTNAFAGLVSSAEDGEGILSKITTGLIAGTFGIDTAILSKLSALNSERLEDLGRTEIEIRDKVNQRLEENQELLTDIQSDQTLLNDKIAKSDQIITNIRRNEEELVDVLNDELIILNDQLAIDKENEAIQTSVLLKKKEIGNVERDAEKRVQAIVRLQDNLNDAEAKRLKLLIEQRSVTESGNRDIDLLSGLNLKEQGGVTERPKEESLLAEGSIGILDSEKALNSALEKLSEDRVAFEKANADKRVKINQVADESALRSAATVAGGIAGIFQEGSDLQKVFALTSIGIDTAEAIAGLTSASENNPANSVSFGAAGAAQFAAGLIRILANIAAAKSYLSGAAAGGGDFVTKGPSLLLVGDNPGGKERVTVEPLSGKGQTKIYGPNLMAMAGGGSLTTGFDPGNVVTNSLTSAYNQRNMFLKMPKIELSVKEITKVQTRIKIRERLI